MKFIRFSLLLPALIAAALVAGFPVDAHGRPGMGASFLHSLAAKPVFIAGTTPKSGDANPYGVAVVPQGFPSGGTIHAGEFLVSNFNSSSGHQGTGRTVVAVTKSGKSSLFFTAANSFGNVGLTTALVALKSGVVIVGSMPTTDGTSKTVSAGGLFFLSSSGKVELYLRDSSLLDGPWGMVADERNPAWPVIYVTNALNGSVTRVVVHVTNGKASVHSLTRIASGIAWRPDPNALVVSPTELLLTPDRKSLFMADTEGNRLVELTNIGGSNNQPARIRTVVVGGPLRGPLALAWVPNGDVIASNGDAIGKQTKSGINRVVEINPTTKRFVGSVQLDTTGTPGAIFGIAVTHIHGKASLVYVDDNTNSLLARSAK